MSLIRIKCCCALLLAAIVGLAPAVSASDDTLAYAKELYASAAYDEALVVLDKIQSKASASDTTAIAEYRVFCLLALNRHDEARQKIEGIVHNNPLYLPSDDQASPRIQSIFRDVRRQALPKIVAERYAAAKTAFEQKDPKAEQQFNQVLAILDDPDVKGVSALGDLRTVVSAFRDLASAMAAQTKELATKAAENAPPAPKDVAPPPPADAIYTSDDADVEPPVGLQSQRMPVWTPTRAQAGQSFNGAIEVLIDEKGTVVSAAIRVSVHPTYDQRLLNAARDWKFTPARRNGIAVRYSRVITIRLAPTPAQ